MKREEVLLSLKKIEPALAGKALFPILSHLLFQKGMVYAYDDALMMSRALDLGGFEGCVPGQLLIDLLGATQSEELELEPSAGTLGLKLGRSRAELVVMDAGEFPRLGLDGAIQPDPAEAVKMAVPEGFVEGLARAAMTMGEDSNQLWCFGVTIESGSGGTRLLSTNQFSVSVVRLKGEGSKKLAELLPPKFVQVFLKMAAKVRPTELLFWPGEWVAAEFEDGTRMLGRTSAEAVPSRFDEVIKKSAPPGTPVPLPQGLANSLHRARIFMTSSVLTERIADFRISKERLTIEVRGDRGNFRDQFKFPGEHPEASVKMVPEILGRVVPNATSIKFGAKCAYLEGPDSCFLVACSSPPAAE